MTEKKTLFKHPGSPLLGEAALEDKLATKSALDMNEDEIEEMLEGIEEDVTVEKLKKEIKEAKPKS